jgi:hypothetical protein
MHILQPFQLKINGTDKNEYDFERKLSTEWEPKKVELIVKAAFGLYDIYAIMQNTKAAGFLSTLINV